MQRKKYILIIVLLITGTMALVSQATEGKENTIVKEGKELLMNGQYEEILILCDDAIINGLHSSEIYKLRGIANYYIRNYNDALADLDIANTLDQKDEICYYYRGLVFMKLNEDQKAITDFSRVIEQDPNDPTAYYLRAVAYGNIREFERALDDINVYMKIESTDKTSAYILKATIYLRKYELSKFIVLFIILGVPYIVLMQYIRKKTHYRLKQNK